jgi:hypothetical protein
MDNGAGGQGSWGRLEPKIGAYVDDAAKTVFAKGLGWVNSKGDVYSGGRWFPVDQHHPEANKQAMAVAAKARQLFETAAPAPLPDQMRSVQQSAAAPKPMAPPAPHPEPHHKLLADGYRTLAKSLLGGK